MMYVDTYVLIGTFLMLFCVDDNCNLTFKTVNILSIIIMFSFTELESRTFTARIECGEQRLATMLAMRRSAGVTPEVNLMVPTSCTPLPIGFFTNTQNWQHWHYCQFCIPIYLQFPSLFATYDVSKCEIRYQWM